MPEIPQFPEALAEALNNFPELNLNLPDPEDEEIPDSEFENVVDTAWKVCVRLVG